MVDGDGNVGFVVNVSKSVYGEDDDIVPGLKELWEEIKEDYNGEDPIADLEVTVGGVTVNLDGTDTTVSYAIAKKAPAIEVTGGEIVSGDKSINAEDGPFTGIIKSDGGEYYNFTIKVSPASQDVTLYDNRTPALSGLKGGRSIEDFVLMFYPKDAKATATYIFTTFVDGMTYSVEWAAGEIADWGNLSKDRGLDTVAMAQIIVTAEDGKTSKIYTALADDAGSAGIVNYYEKWNEYVDETLTLPLYGSIQNNYRALKVIDIPGVKTVVTDGYSELFEAFENGTSQDEMKAMYEDLQEAALEATRDYLSADLDKVLDLAKNKNTAVVEIGVRLARFYDILNYGSFPNGVEEEQGMLPHLWSHFFDYAVDTCLTGSESIGSWNDEIYDGFNGPLKASQLSDNNDELMNYIDSAAIAADDSYSNPYQEYVDIANTPGAP